MKVRIICAGVLAAVFFTVPMHSSGGHIKKSEQAAASNVGQMRQQRAETTSDARNNSDIAARNLLTTEASSQVQQSKRKVPENAPTKPIAAVETEMPNSEPESTARQEKPAVPSKPQPIDDKEALLQAAGVPSNEWSAVKYIFFKESTWRPAVTNSIGCIGLGQNCPDKNGKLWLTDACPDWQSNPVCQIKRFSHYAEERYGGWWQAHAFWLEKGWW